VSDPGPDGGDRPVDRAALERLSSDDWAAVLVAVRAELRTRGGLSEQQAAVADQSTSRLVAGRGRAQVVDLLVDDVELVAAVGARVSASVRAAMTGPEGSPDRPAGAGGSTSAGEAARARERARALREERDVWRRRAEGAEARAEQADRALAQQAAEQEDLRDTIAALRRELAEAAADRDRAVVRERRRRDGEVARLEADLAALRRAEEARRADRSRRERAARRRAVTDHDAAEGDPIPRVPPGRPTRLPPDFVPGTTEAARALLGPGRLVLIDGYNLTLNHRADLDLEGQRTWLVGLCANAVPVHRIRPVIYFDGERAGGGRPAAARQAVQVRFTPEGITADDELVLAVEATDEPVVVVTDDRELTERVTASGADVVGTVAFLGVIRR
jgi:hypothetical protein